MSHDINGELASLSAHAQSAVTRNIGQRQQWKLALEKAYLSLERSECEATNDREREAPPRGDEESDSTRVDLQPGSVGGLLPGNPEDVPAQNSPSPIAKFANEGSPTFNIVEGVEKAILATLQGEGNSHALNMRVSGDNDGGKGLSAPERNGAAPKSLEKTAKENMFHLYFEEGGVHLSLRHGGGVPAPDQVYRIISVVRALLERQGFHLAKVTVNGVERWKSRESHYPQSMTDDETGLNEVDRMY